MLTIACGRCGAHMAWQRCAACLVRARLLARRQGRLDAQKWLARVCNHTTLCLLIRTLLCVWIRADHAVTDVHNMGQGGHSLAKVGHFFEEGGGLQGCTQAGQPATHSSTTFSLDHSLLCVQTRVYHLVVDVLAVLVHIHDGRHGYCTHRGVCGSRDHHRHPRPSALSVHFGGMLPARH
jgi:hypothetical protein